MKKLISLLMVLLLALTGVFALAEDVPTEPETPAVTEPAEGVEPVEGVEPAEGTEPAADVEPAEGTEPAEDEPGLITKGLIVTGFGLAGVFLVLILFFLTIKMMGKMLK